MKKTKKVAYINPNACDRSPGCPPIKVCPVQAITHEKTGMFSYKASLVDSESCTGCQKCLNYCPRGAIKMVAPLLASS